MSDYYILNSHEKDMEAKVVFHIPIPDENTEVSSVNLRTALKEHKPFTTSIIPNFATKFSAEQTKLENGELYEHEGTVEYSGNDTNANKLQAVKNKFTNLSTSILNRIRAELKYWGKNGDVS